VFCLGIADGTKYTYSLCLYPTEHCYLRDRSVDKLEFSRVGLALWKHDAWQDFAKNAEVMAVEII
jgi:hypothetical protein